MSVRHELFFEPRATNKKAHQNLVGFLLGRLLVLEVLVAQQTYFGLSAR